MEDVVLSLLRPLVLIELVIHLPHRQLLFCSCVVVRFDKIDTGKTSQVTLAELSTYLETIGQDTKLAAFLINSWDVDGDGMLSREEFLAITKEVIH